MTRVERIGISGLFILLALTARAPEIARAEEGGAVVGKVAFSGSVPEPADVNFGAEKQCALVHGGHAPKVETVVVNPNRTLRWVLVYVKDAVLGTYTPPAEPALIDQLGCIFKPHATAVMAGQPVTFRNNDSVLHNVRAQSTKRQSFNIAQPIKDMSTTKTFKEPEIGIPLKCDVHFWMMAYLHVLPHPFFAVTGEDGSFSISGLPAGTYTLEAWHEKFGVQTASVTVAPGATQPVEFTFTGS